MIWSEADMSTRKKAKVRAAQNVDVQLNASPVGAITSRDGLDAEDRAENNAAPAQKTFRLLDLCAELRNNIYEKVCEETRSHLSPWSNGHLIGNSALSGVNRQVRKEFLPIFYLHSSTITVQIYDFDYRHVVSFLNKLGEHELHALRVRTERSMIFRMYLSSVPASRLSWSTSPLGLGDAPSLEAWLKRLQHPTKKGTRLYIDYETFGKSVEDLGRWWDALSSLEQRFKGDRALVELSVMKSALEEAGAI